MKFKIHQETDNYVLVFKEKDTGFLLNIVKNDKNNKITQFILSVFNDYLLKKFEARFEVNKKDDQKDGWLTCYCNLYFNGSYTGFRKECTICPEPEATLNKFQTITEFVNSSIEFMSELNKQ